MIDMSVVYIAGPISGEKDYKQKVARAGRYLHQMGFDVILNPAEMLPEEIEPKQALPICLRMIESSEIVFFCLTGVKVRARTLSGYTPRIWINR